MRSSQVIRPEFSRIVDIDRVDVEEELHEIEATADERAALAERFGLVALESLTASLRLEQAKGGAVRVSGAFSADIVQACVLTLEPVPSRIEETFTVLYVPETEAPESAETVVLPEGVEMPEPLVGDAIDVGEAVAQQLAVSLDPYPRASGATFDGSYGPEGTGPAPGARLFAGLEVLRKKTKGR